jgi:hypothetical protein
MLAPFQVLSEDPLDFSGLTRLSCFCEPAPFLDHCCVLELLAVSDKAPETLAAV